MKIEKIDNNKIKIMFDSTELEENDISIHSFLSNSENTKKLFLAILDIANEEFGFNAKNCKISYEAISFDNKKFVIIITKNPVSVEKRKAEKNASPYNLLEITNSINNEFKSTSNVKPKKADFPIFNTQNDTEILLYKFENMEELFSFCNYLESFNNTVSFNNSLYEYNDKYFLEINLENLDYEKRKKIVALISEYNTNLNLDCLCTFLFKEHVTLLINNNAIENLQKKI